MLRAVVSMLMLLRCNGVHHDPPPPPLTWVSDPSLASFPVVGNALLIAGAVSKLPIPRKSGQYTSADSLYDEKRPYSAVHVCANSIKRHLLAPSIKKHVDKMSKFDVFLHTWSFDLEPELRSSFNLTSAEFEGWYCRVDLINRWANHSRSAHVDLILLCSFYNR